MKPTFAIVLLLLAGFTFTACENDAKPKENDEAKSSDTVTTASAESTYPVDTLTPAIAKARVDAFTQVVIDSADKEFSLGFNLSHGDIQALYKDNDTTNQDTVYAMIGYDLEINSFDLIFCIETPINSEHYIYVDFTNPCPTYCPGYTDPVPGGNPTLSALNGNKGFWFGREGMTDILNTGAGDSVESYLMLKGDEWDQGVYLVVCPDDCSAPDEENAYFAPCSTAGQPDCYQF